MGPLEGIRVVELSTGIAGPLAGMLLADYGADVVKVEPPTGDPARRLAGFAVWNRNKQSVVLDRRTDAGHARLSELLAGADVCIYADPTQLDGPEGPDRDLADENPGLVRLYMPPYVPAETPWAGGGESHALLAALGGSARRQASFDGGPIQLVYPVEFYEQGVWAAACAVAALVERQRSGLGQTVTVAGIHGVLACIPGQFVVDLSQPPAPTSVGPGGRHPTYTTYRCGDGEWLFMAGLTPKFQANAFKTLGVGDLHADPRIANQPNRLIVPENRVWVRALLEEAFATRTRDEWLEALELGDCPVGPLGNRDEWLDHPQVTANDLRVEIDDPERGQVVMPGPCIGFSKTPGSVRAPAPRLGEHTETGGRWERRVGDLTPLVPRGPLSGAERGEHRPGLPPPRAGEAVGIEGPHGRVVGRGGEVGPLAGLRVLDLGTILAGPYAGTLLAGLGADVVKVEAPSGDAFRETGFIYNRGMRGLAIDLSRSSGQYAFHQLVKTVDVVVDNSRLGVAKRLKADYLTLSEVNPKVITLSIAGFGEHGAFAHRPAFDPVLQAMSGMMGAQGGDSDPSFFTIPINDVVAAVTAVLGICLALYHRNRTGEGQRAWTSLVASSLTMQSGELVRYEGRPPAPIGGRDFAGPSPAERFYQTADGWLCVQAPSIGALAEALGVRLSDAADITHERVTAVFEEVLAALSLGAALDRLRAASIPAVPARQPIDVARDPAVAALDLLTEQRFPDGTPYLIPNRYARFSRTEQAPLGNAPGIGEHSRAVLAEAGLADEEIDALVEEGIVKEGEPFVLKALVNYR